MRGVISRGKWFAVLVVLLCAGAQAMAGPGALSGEEAHIQLFSAVERSVVAIGEPFILTVEIYASPPSEEAARQVERAFARAHFAAGLEDIELVRSEAVEQKAGPSEDGTSVLHLSRRFILRARRIGEVVLPALGFAYGARTYATAPYTLEVYAVDPAFFEAGRSVLPVVAQHRDRSRIYTRIGSAFLIAPDAVVTSFHVVVDVPEVRLRLPNGRWIRTRWAWSVDPARDVAVLYVNPKAVRKAGLTPIRPAPMADAVRHWKEPLPDGRVVFTNGWPRGLQRSTAGTYYQDVSLQRHTPIWVSANPVRPGDSGGPLLDRYGRAIGVISAGSVLHASRDVLREEVCIATDFRPALGQRTLARRPRALYTLFRDPVVSAHPHAHALRLSVFLSLHRYRSPAVEASLEQLNETLHRTAGDPDLHFVRGTIHQAYGRLREATDAYRAALEVYEDYFPAAYMLALNYLQAGNYTEASRLFQRTGEYPPYAHLAAFGLAQTKVRRLQYEAAVPELQEVLHYDPDFPPALYELAYCYIALGDEVRARQIAAKLDSIAPPWAGRLRQVLRYPILRPFVLPPLPRAALPVSALPR